MQYSVALPIVLSILTSVIAGGFVLVFVEISNRLIREFDRFELQMTPFMHKLSAYFRFISWCNSHIIYPQTKCDNEKEFERLIKNIRKYGSELIITGGDYPVEYFKAKELSDIAYQINNIWYYHDKMRPCNLSWDNSPIRVDYINKELKEINPLYLSLNHDIGMIAHVSGDFYTDIYQPIKRVTYKYETQISQYRRNRIFVGSSFVFVLIILGSMLLVELPVPLMQILTLGVILLFMTSVLSLAINIKTQIRWWNNTKEFWNKNIVKFSKMRKDICEKNERIL